MKHFIKNFMEPLNYKPKMHYEILIPPPPPPPKEIVVARMLVEQIEIWQNGNKLVEMDLWQSLSNRALEQVEKIKQSQASTTIHDSGLSS